MAYLFEWDSGNLQKMALIRQSGREISVSEVESVFEDPSKLTQLSYPDPNTGEPRYLTWGMSNQNRVISVIFVTRAGKIRVVNTWKTKGSKLKQYHAEKKLEN